MHNETRKIMQYVYQVRNTIAIDEEYHYKSNNFKYHKYAK